MTASKTAELRDKLIQAAVNYVVHVSEKCGYHFSESGAELRKAVENYRLTGDMYEAPTIQSDR